MRKSRKKYGILFLLLFFAVMYCGKIQQLRIENEKAEQQIRNENQSYMQQDTLAGDSASSGVSENTIQNTVQDAIQGTAQNVTQDTAQNAIQDTAQNETRETAQNMTQVTDRNIRVILMNQKESSYYHEQITVRSTADITMSGSRQEVFAANTEICISDLLNPDEEAELSTDAGNSIQLLSIARIGYHPEYEGVLHVCKTAQGCLIINEVDLETYLKYVVPSEMPSSSPAEALKAQAVCARTYAVSQIAEGRLQEWGADVDDSVSCQVYNHIGRQESTDMAVDSTSQYIMTCDRKPITAYFFSTSWGVCGLDDVWGVKDTSPYLAVRKINKETVETLAVNQSQQLSAVDFEQAILTVNENDYEKEDIWYRWHITFPYEVLDTKCLEQFPQIGTFVDAQIQKRTSGGAADILCITGTEGSVIIERELAIRKFFSQGELPLICNDGSECYTMGTLPSGYFITVNDAAARTLTLYGGGYGHGAGMSQNGAVHMAEDGVGWEDILHVFFQSITIEKRYG